MNGCLFKTKGQINKIVLTNTSWLWAEITSLKGGSITIGPVLGIKQLRYFPRSNPWGTLADSDGAQPALCTTGDLSWHVAIPVGVSRQNIWAPWPHLQTLELLGHRHSKESPYFSSSLRFRTSRKFQNHSQGEHPPTPMGPQGTEATFAPGNCMWILTLMLSASTPWFLLASEIKKVLRQSSPWTPPKAKLCWYPSDPPSCTKTGFAGCHLSRVPTTDSHSQSFRYVTLVFSS